MNDQIQAAGGIERQSAPATGPPVRRGARLHPWMRMTKGREYSSVYRRGSRARGNLVTIAAAPNGSGGTRLGLSIGKKVDKRAVVRNRLRRLFREAFRLEYDRLPSGYDLVVIGSTPKPVVTLVDARRELVKLAVKAARRSEDRQREERERGAAASGTTGAEAARPGPPA
ncbi:ribonuclease P protein component [Rohdeia mirabilis]